MRRGGYIGPTEPLGLIGCLILVPFYLFGFGFILEDFGYGGAPGWQVVLLLAGLTALAFVLARGLSLVIARLRKR